VSVRELAPRKGSDKRRLEGAVAVADEHRKGRDCFRGQGDTGEIGGAVGVDVVCAAVTGADGKRDGCRVDIGAIGLGKEDAKLGVAVRGIRDEVVEVGAMIAIEVRCANGGGVSRHRDVARVAEGFGAEWSGGEKGGEAESKEAIQRGVLRGRSFLCLRMIQQVVLGGY